MQQKYAMQVQLKWQKSEKSFTNSAEAVREVVLNVRILNKSDEKYLLKINPYFIESLSPLTLEEVCYLKSFKHSLYWHVKRASLAL